MTSILIDFMLLSNKTALYIFQLRGGVPKKRRTDLREGDVRPWRSWWKNLTTGQLVIVKNEIYNIKEKFKLCLSTGISALLIKRSEESDRSSRRRMFHLLMNERTEIRLGVGFISTKVGIIRH